MPASVFVLEFKEEHGHLAENHISWRKRMGRHLFRCIQQKPEVPRIDAKKRQPCAPVLADAAQHGTVSTDHVDKIRLSSGHMLAS